MDVLETTDSIEQQPSMYVLAEVSTPNFQVESTRKKDGFAFDAQPTTKYFFLDKKSTTDTGTSYIGQGMIECALQADGAYTARYLQFGRPDGEHDYRHVANQPLPPEAQTLINDKLHSLNALHQLKSEIEKQ